jgi:DNA-binding NarL/FixJ family response regulator
MLLNSEPDLQVITQVGSGDEVRAFFALGEVVDIAIVEVELGDGHGMDVIRELCAHDANIEVLVLTGSSDKRIHGSALLSGASGIVSKTAAPVDLIESIRKLAAGESLMPVTEAAILLAQGERYQQEEEKVQAALAELTVRERQVLSGLVAGMSNDAIAAEICVSWETVRSHVVKILQKLDASSRLQAAVLAIRHGFDDELAGS